jgi:GNAT superfamily N-acetyltransferase
LIRAATPQDVAQMVELGRQMVESTSYGRYTYSVDKVAALCTELIKSPTGIALVAEQEGQLVGAFVGSVYPMWFSTELEASDYAMFVHPDYRRSAHALHMVRAFVEQAKSLGASRICIGNSTGFEPEKVRALYEMAGFKFVGYNLEHAG